MPISFQSIRSGSSGNCLMVWTDSCRILIDCGLGSQLAANMTLTELLGRDFKIDGVVASHTHGDHINYSCLRVLQQHKIPLFVHEKSVAQLADKHYKSYKFDDLILAPFTDNHFQIGDIVVEPVEVRHEPQHATFGFAINHKCPDGWQKMLIATDFNHGPQLAEHMLDAKFIFIEANYDLQLLKENPNYASKFHMSNPQSAQMIFTARAKRKHAPAAVMLGHLSQKRNLASIALDTVKNTFATGQLELDFKLSAAPRYNPSETITLS